MAAPKGQGGDVQPEQIIVTSLQGGRQHPGQCARVVRLLA